MEWDEPGRVAVIDVETTGVDPKSDRVISVAIFQTQFDPQGDELRGDTMTTVVNPGVPIPREASRVNGFRDRDVADKPTFADEADELREFIGDRELVGHNVSFDKRFLSAEFKRAGVKTLHRNRSHCTMYGACDWLSEITGWWSSRRIGLDRALEVFDVPGRKAKTHDALEDVKLTAMLAARLCQLEGLPKSRTKQLRRHVKDHASTNQRASSRQRRRGVALESPRPATSKRSYKWIWIWVFVLLAWAWLASD